MFDPRCLIFTFLALIFAATDLKRPQFFGLQASTEMWVWGWESTILGFVKAKDKFFKSKFLKKLCSFSTLSGLWFKVGVSLSSAKPFECLKPNPKHVRNFLSSMARVHNSVLINLRGKNFQLLRRSCLFSFPISQPPLKMHHSIPFFRSVKFHFGRLANILQICVYFRLCELSNKPAGLKKNFKSSGPREVQAQL